MANYVSKIVQELPVVSQRDQKLSEALINYAKCKRMKQFLGHSTLWTDFNVY